MERLTKKRDRQNVIPLKQNGETKWAICSAGMGDAPTEYLYGEHADRLAAYEDTGLEPEEVNVIAGLASENCAKVADKIDQLLSDDKELEQYRALGPIDRLRELARADRMIGKEVWAQAKYLNIFQTKPSLIQRTTIQYVSLLKGGDILCHTQTCAFPLNEIGKTVFLTREEAEATQRREQDEKGGSSE